MDRKTKNQLDIDITTSSDGGKNNGLDLISRQDAIDAIDGLPNCYNGFSDSYDKSYIIGVLEELPSAEPEIIRCMECKHYKIDHPNTNGYHCCYRNHNIFPMNEDDFCSRAERRTDG